MPVFSRKHVFSQKNFDKVKILRPMSAALFEIPFMHYSHIISFPPRMEVAFGARRRVAASLVFVVIFFMNTFPFISAATLPKGTPPAKLFRIAHTRLSKPELIALTSLQGILAKGGAENIYLDDGSGGYKHWLEILKTTRGTQVGDAASCRALLTHFANAPAGYLLCRAADQRSLAIAGTLAGPLRGVIIDESLQPLADSLGWKQLHDTREKDYAWLDRVLAASPAAASPAAASAAAGNPGAAASVIVSQPPGQVWQARDYAVLANAQVVPAPAGGKDNPADESETRLAALARRSAGASAAATSTNASAVNDDAATSANAGTGAPPFLLGWGDGKKEDEQTFIGRVSRLGLPLIPADHARNLSVLSSLPMPDGGLKQHRTPVPTPVSASAPAKIPNPKNQIPKKSQISKSQSSKSPAANAAADGGATAAAGVPAASIPNPVPSEAKSLTSKIQNTHAVTFVLSDGDNMSWLLFDCPVNDRWFASPARGQVPLGWGMAPALAELAPGVVQWYYAAANAAEIPNPKNQIPKKSQEPNLKFQNTEAFCAGDSLGFGICKRQRVCDHFVAGPSGNGYFYPSLMPPGALAAHCAELNRLMGFADLRLVQIIDNDALGRTDLWDAYLSQPNIDGLIYFDYAPYDKHRGRITWARGKPVVSAAMQLWGPGDHASTPAKPSRNSPDAIVARLNKAPRDPYSENGYSLVVVHVWTHTVADIAALAARLDPGVEVVAPDEFFRRVQTNLAPKTKNATGASIP
jgi:hypothetical protein